MTGLRLFFLIFGIVMVVAILGYYFYRMKHPVTEKQEKRRVGRMLKVWTAQHGFQQYDNPIVVHEGISGWADHIILGHFGVLLVYDHCTPGDYHGEPDGETWSIIDGNVRYQMRNPRNVAAVCTGRVRTLFRDSKIKVDVYTIHVLTGPKKRTSSYIKTDDIIKINALSSYLRKERFEEDKGFDAKRLSELLESALHQKEQTNGK